MSEDFNLERDISIRQLKEKLSPEDQAQLDSLLSTKEPPNFKEFLSQPDPEFSVDEALPGSKKTRMMVLKLAYLDFIRMLFNHQINVELECAPHVNAIINQFEWLMGIDPVPDSYKDKGNLNRIRKEYKVLIRNVGEVVKERRAAVSSLKAPSSFSQFLKEILGVNFQPDVQEKNNKKKRKK